MGTHFSFLFSIYSENHGVQAEPLNFTRSSNITCALFLQNSIFLRKNLDGKEVRYDERVFGRDENDQGSGVASEGFF